MRKFYFLFALTLIALSVTFIACNNTPKAPPKDDELSSFMLGGIYFVNGYGGKATFDAEIAKAGTSNDELISSHRELFIFPFPQDNKVAIKKEFSEWWDVNSKEDFLKILDELKLHKLKSSTHKAWDYARYVNNVCMGYAAGYITKEEGKKLTMEILPIAKSEYKTWDDYFADFIAGRVKWDPSPSADKTAFENLAKTMTQGEHNIYKLLPLNN